MVFSSTLFLFWFLPVVLIGYYLCGKKAKNYWLLLASLFFYSWGEPKYVLLMFTLIVINYICGLLLARDHNRYLLCATVIFNLGILGYFKYFNFLMETVNAVLSLIGGQTVSLNQIALPIGISFFTFQIMSYVIDVYRGTVPPQKSLAKLALYISLFPQLIAGPIVRYSDVAAQIDERNVTLGGIYTGAVRFMIGLSKKVLLSNQMAAIADAAFIQSDPPALLAWMGAVAYALQIYFDFSGYSDMAIGLGKLFGFDFLENFNYPYISSSVKEFWRRWHISLSSWFRDYLYIPLGGSHCSREKTYRNLLIVFSMTGLWHGASWNFVVWGLWHGAFLILERVLGNRFRMPKWLGHIYTMLVVLIGWVFFRADTLGQAAVYLRSMAGNPLEGALYSLSHLDREKVFFFALSLIFCLPAGKWINSRLGETSRSFAQTARDTALAAVFFVTILYVVSSGFNPFIYFRF
jgi:alginate O-acetyltransferase complex protein AlgI